MPISISMPDGIVTITSVEAGVERQAPPYRETIAVSGGILGFVIDDLSAMPEAFIDDLGAALLWLPHVYGERINDEVLDLLSRAEVQSDEAVSATLPDRKWLPLELSGWAARVALSEWLLQWWPSQGVGIHKLNRPLLALERATIKWEHPLLFEEASTAHELEALLPETASFLPAMLDDLVAGVTEPESALLWRSAQAITHLLDLESSDFVAVEAAYEARCAARGTDDFDWAVGQARGALQAIETGRVSPAPDAGIQHVVDFEMPGRDGFVLAAADAPWEEADEYLTVDPVQVVARSVAGFVDNVGIVLDRDANTLSVRVQPGDAPVPHLRARVWTKNGMLPRMLVLDLTPDGYLGDTSLDDLDPATLDVFDDRLVSQPRETGAVLDDVTFVSELVRRRIDRAAGWRGAADDPMGPFVVETER